MIPGYGISTIVCAELDIKTLLSRIAEAGFGQVELMCEQPHFNPATFDADSFRKLTEDLSIVIRSGHCPIADTDCGSLDQRRRRASVEMMAACLEPLASIGAEILVVHVNGPQDYNKQTCPKSWESSARSLQELSTMAASAGMKIAVENLPHYHTDRPGHAMSQLRELIADLGEHVGLCLDVSHALVSGHDPVEELAVAGERLFCLHLHDCDGQEDGHLLPGQGVIDWTTLIDELNSMNFAGLRMIESVAEKAELDDALSKTYSIVTEWKALG